jgi:hypothetical protein
MSTLADMHYGPLPGAPAAAAALDPATTPAATRATDDAPRRMGGEPGAKPSEHSMAMIKDNPVSWLIITLALAVAAARYAATGKLV